MSSLRQSLYEEDAPRGQRLPRKVDPALGALQREWYDRLAAEGFVDIERPTNLARRVEVEDTILVHDNCGDRKFLRRWDGAGGDEYYARAGRWVHLRVFPSRFARWVWELHSEGLYPRQILAVIGTVRGHQLRKVKELIARERRRMDIYFGSGADDDDARPQSLLEQHLAAEDDFRHITNRGEGGAAHTTRGGSMGSA